MGRIRHRTKLATEELDDVWDEDCTEAELDAAALQIASLLTQVIRRFLSGTLPSEDGQGSILALRCDREAYLAWIGMFAQLAMMLVLFLRNERKLHSGLGYWGEHLYKLLQQTLNFFGGWCFYLTIEWFVVSNMNY